MLTPIINKLGEIQPLTNQDYLTLVCGASIVKRPPAIDFPREQVSELIGYALEVCTANQIMALTDVLLFLEDGTPLNGFPNLWRGLLSLQMCIRVFDQSPIQQGNTELCGPVAFTIDLCMTRPLQYVTAVIELARSGETSIDKLQLKPHDKIKKAIPSGLPTGVAQADYVILGSLRDLCYDEKLIWVLRQGWKHNITDSGVAPLDFFEWLVKAGYANVIWLQPGRKNKVHPDKPGLKSQITGKQFTVKECMMNASQLLNSGWKVFLFADSILGQAMEAYTRAAGVEDEGVSQVMRQQTTKVLDSAHVGGHVMYLRHCVVHFADQTVDMAVYNRGAVQYYHQMPLAAVEKFMSHILAANDHPDDPSLADETLMAQPSLFN